MYDLIKSNHSLYGQKHLQMLNRYYIHKYKIKCHDRLYFQRSIYDNFQDCFDKDSLFSPFPIILTLYIMDFDLQHIYNESRIPVIFRSSNRIRDT